MIDLLLTLQTNPAQQRLDVFAYEIIASKECFGIHTTRLCLELNFMGLKMQCSNPLVKGFCGF